MDLQCLIAVQQQFIKALSALSDRCSPEMFDTLTLGAIDAAAAQARELWEKITAYHEKIFTHPEVLDHEYHRNSVYTSAHAVYGELDVALATRRANIIADAKRAPAPRPVEDSLLDFGLEVFAGDLRRWPTFGESFYWTITQNKSLNDNQRMRYLIRYTAGEALELINSLPATNNCFEEAWQQLRYRYGNPRLLATSYIDELLDNSAVTDGNAEELSSLIRRNHLALDVIHSTGVTTDDWDPLLVQATLRHLPAATQEEWESSLNDSIYFAPYSQLEEFLARKLLAWSPLKDADSSGDSPKETKSMGPPTEQEYAPLRTPVHKARKCPLCQDVHYVLYCPRYQAANVTQKQQFVREHRLCFNCLGPHRLVDCKTKEGCKSCGQKHHSSIHADPDINSPT